MSENQSSDPTHRQDPAEPNEVDQSVDTTDQADSEPVEVSPADPSVKTDNIHGVDYKVTPEEGYRRS